MTTSFSEKSPFVEEVSASFMYPPEIDLTISSQQLNLAWLDGFSKNAILNVPNLAFKPFF